MKNNDNDFGELQAEINHRFGEGALRSFEATDVAHIDVEKTGSSTLDEALGIGGYPRGRIVELFGPESSGKTTLTLHAIAEVHKRGGTAAFIDAEHAFDKTYARALGVDLNRLLVSQPDCGEQGLDITSALVDSGKVDLVVVDSVAALVPKAEIDGDMGDNHVGLHARLMSRGVRKITADAHRTNTTVLFINQLRQRIGVVFGNPETTTGGNALRFFASVRIDVRRIGKACAGEKVIGNRTRAKVVKNKLAPPFGEAEFDIRWGEGIDTCAELLETALGRGVVTRSGAHFAFGKQALGQGKERAREALLSVPKLREEIERACAPVRNDAVEVRSVPQATGAAAPEATGTKRTASGPRKVAA